MLLSVIIPVYNSEDTIIKCIDSVIAELSCNEYSWELIIVDDGSRDSSARLIEEYMANSRFRDFMFLIKQKNGGVAAARNQGILLSRGDYLAFNDSDDKWLPGKMKLQMDYLLSHPDVALIAGLYGDDKINVLKKMGNENVITIKDQAFKNYFAPPTVIFHRMVLEKTGMFPSMMKYMEDAFFFNKIIYHYKCILLNERVACCICQKGRWGDCGLSGNLWQMEKGELYNLRYAYNFHYINLLLFGVAYSFSLIKFLRRLVISWGKIMLKHVYLRGGKKS